MYGFFDAAIFMVYIMWVPLVLGFIITGIAWIWDLPKLERIGINTSLAGVVLLVLSMVTCTAGCLHGH